VEVFSVHNLIPTPIIVSSVKFTQYKVIAYTHFCFSVHTFIPVFTFISFHILTKNLYATHKSCIGIDYQV